MTFLLTPKVRRWETHSTRACGFPTKPPAWVSPKGAAVSGSRRAPSSSMFLSDSALGYPGGYVTLPRGREVGTRRDARVRVSSRGVAEDPFRYCSRCDRSLPRELFRWIVRSRRGCGRFAASVIGRRRVRITRRPSGEAAAGRRSVDADHRGW